MAKWKCEICGNEFNNFHAQGFDNKIYCPLCYFKKENQELKQKYLNAVADYETIMFEKEQLNSLVNSCQEEIRQLKKQLEEYKHKGLYNTCLPYSTGYKKAIKEKENQQKEFIKYLEDDLKEKYRDMGYRHNIFREILDKYEEIIGDIDDKR